MITSHPWWPLKPASLRGIHLGQCYSFVISRTLKQEKKKKNHQQRWYSFLHCFRSTLLRFKVKEQSSIPPCMTVTRLWCPSICHKLFGAATEYALLEITTAQWILEFPESTRSIFSLIPPRWTLRPIMIEDVRSGHQGIPEQSPMITHKTLYEIIYLLIRNHRAVCYLL